ncbi:MAG: TonB C-terminal domain-containing protein [Candidatus Caenarcaniphilales bacterium]|nr:TonB C-terminal domain-containing protein [Candidatus Caenarcaniphilales bacterium]
MNSLTEKEQLQEIKRELSSNEGKLLGFSYLSVGFGFGPFIPLVAAWVFRKNTNLHRLLLQSAFFQGLFSTVSFGIFVYLVYLAYLKGDASTQNSINKLGLGISLIHGAFDWFSKILFFILSLFVFKNPNLKFPFVYLLTESFAKLFERKTLKKTIVLNTLWPGLGQLLVGKVWLGWILVFCHLLVACSLFFILLAKFNYALSKDLLTLMGFYIRVGDKVFQESIVTEWVIGSLAALFVFDYLVAFLNLPLWGQVHRVQRTFFASLTSSFSFHLAVLWVLLLLPFIMNKQSLKEQVKQNSQAAYKELVEQQKAQEDYEKQKKLPQQNPQEKIINFDLELADSIEDLNKFSNKPYSKKFSKQDLEPKPPTIGFGKRQEPLPDKKIYLKKHSRETKSYSEYLTAKVREGGRDQLIWKEAPDPYSMVLQYTVSADGYISDIRIVQPSGNLQMDALVISVVESMNPLIKPPKAKKVVITELFWNTSGQDRLDTDLKRSLATYPDGRVIESK